MNEVKKTVKIEVSGEKIFGMESWQIKAMLPIVGVILFIIVSLGLVIVPKMNQIGDLRNETNQVNNKISDLNKKREYLQSVDEAELKAKEEVLLMAMPESKDIYFLLNVVSGVVSDYGFVVDAFSFSPGELKDIDEENPDISRVSFDLELIGPADSYIDLIDGLENSLPLMSLDEVESKIMSTETTQMKLKLVTYFAQGKPKINVSNLAYEDLIMTKTELELLETLVGFNKIEGLFAVDGGLEGGKTYQEYELRNPFSN